MHKKRKQNHEQLITTVRYMTLAFIALTTSWPLFAQSGVNGINAATTEVKSYFAVGTQLMYAIGAIVGLVGAVKVYNKWNQGDNDTSKVAAAWFGSCIFLVVVALVLGAFFNV